VEQAVSKPTPAPRAWSERVTRFLFAPVDAASLGAFRIMFGCIMLWEVFRYFRYGWIYEYYIAPPVHFKFLFFEWVQRWPGNGMYVHFAVLGVLAALIAVGLFYRLAAALFFLGFSYVFLLDQGRYLNHFYLTCLVAFLLIWVGTDRWAALDRRLSTRPGPETVPFWNLFLLRAQMFIVYFYAGIAKLNPDWLRGEPIGSWIAARAEGLPFERLLAQPWVAWAAAYFALFFDLSIGFLLLWRRTRPVGIVLALLFHTANNFLFHIGIFPYLGMALTLLFLEPDWPRRLLARLRRTREGETPASQSADGRRQKAVRSGEQEPSALTAQRAPEPSALSRNRKLVLGFLGLYLAAQLLIPLRHWLYPGDVAWTEEGHRFSWRMKLRDKESMIAVMVRDPATGREWEIDPNIYLPPHQLDEMMGRPDMVLQFAHYLRDYFRRSRGVPNPEVYASVLCSLNGAPEQELIDPDVNLAAERRTLWPAHWIRRRDVSPEQDLIPSVRHQ
jgi:vitamin K-dependent gamma-carboxylase-like protein